jgi:HEPN domain-containing protein
VEGWLGKASEDLAAADVLLGSGVDVTDAVAFHAQQAAEKALKAFLIRHQVRFGRSHDVEELLELAEPCGPGISAALSEAAALTTYAVDARYPGAQRVTRDEAARLLSVARQVVDTVVSNLRTYLAGGHSG